MDLGNIMLTAKAAQIKICDVKGRDIVILDQNW